MEAHRGWPENEELSELQQLCFRVILTNFDRYCAVFKMPDNKVPKENREFLARRFTGKIFFELKQMQLLKSEHLDFLIGPYMKTLDTDGMAADIIPDLIDKLKTNGNNVLSFKARHLHEDIEVMSSLVAALPKLEEIEYTGKITWPKKPRFVFRKIPMPHYFLRDSSIFKAIGKNCHSLKTLKLHIWNSKKVRNYNDGIAYILKRCPYLETLEYPDTVGALYTLHKRFLFSVGSKKYAAKKNVRYVLRNLSSNNRYYPLDDALEICVAVCPDASYLQIDKLQSDKELEIISNFSSLTDVKFEEMTNISPTNLNKFLQLRGSNIMMLDIPYVSGLNVETLIESCLRLRSLRLEVQPRSFCGSGEFSCSASLPDLEMLDFLNADFSIQAAGAALKLILSAAENIKRLSLTRSSGLTNEFVNSLKLHNIRELDLSSSDVIALPLKALVLHGNLKTLNIKYCWNVTDREYSDLTSDAGPIVIIWWYPATEPNSLGMFAARWFLVL